MGSQWQDILRKVKQKYSPISNYKLNVEDQSTDNYYTNGLLNIKKLSK